MGWNIIIYVLIENIIFAGKFSNDALFQYAPYKNTKMTLLLL